MPIVITGMGIISALGTTVQESWDALIRGETGVRTLTRCEQVPGHANAAAEIHTVLPKGYTDRLETFAVHAATEAMCQAGITTEMCQQKRLAIVVGCSLWGMQALVESTERLRVHGSRRMPPWSLPAVMSNGPAAKIAGNWGATGLTLTLNTACASGADAIGLGMTLLQARQADIVLAGGAEAPIVPWVLAAGHAMRAAADDRFPPDRSCRPWDVHRSGTVSGEGAAFVVLEREEDMRQRSVPCLARCEAYHSLCLPTSFVAPSVEGMRICLEAVRGGNAIHKQGLCVHGSGTTLGDASEMAAIKAVFGRPGTGMPAWGTKGAFGHTLGAGGAMDIVMAVQALHTGIIPPTRNLDHWDPVAPPLSMRQIVQEYILAEVITMVMGFGGHHAAFRLGASW